MITIRKNHLRLHFVWIVLAAMLVGCSPSDSQPTTVAALQQNAATLTSTATVTYVPGDTIYGPVTGPGYTQDANMQPTAIPSTPLPISTNGMVQPTIGAVIDPNNYTPPPTSTPIPSATQPLPAIATDSGAATFGAIIDPNYTPNYTPGTPGISATQPAGNGTLPPAATEGPSPTPGGPLRSALMGIQIHGFLQDTEWNKMLERSKALGVGWIKVQILWKEYEPNKGQFTDLYRAMILNIQRASIAGFRTMISVVKAPGWARQMTDFAEDGPSADPQDFANFVAQFIRDCKPEFIDAIEIWNEPNLQREWHGKPLSGQSYMAYFDAAYKAIVTEQQTQPSATKPNHRITVITAGLAPTGTSGASMNDRDFLQQMYDTGLRSYGSDVVIGVHPYGWANSPDAVCCTAQNGVTGWFEHPSFYFRNTLEDYHKIMVRNNHAAGKLWVTEFGWATYDGLRRSDGSPASAAAEVGWQKLINQGQQADYVLRAFQMVQQPPYYDYVGPMMLWNLNFATIPTMVDNSREEAAFSLLDTQGNPRPVFNAISSAPKQ